MTWERQQCCPSVDERIADDGPPHLALWQAASFRIPQVLQVFNRGLGGHTTHFGSLHMDPFHDRNIEFDRLRSIVNRLVISAKSARGIRQSRTSRNLPRS